MKYALNPHNLKRWPQILAIMITILIIGGVGSILLVRNIYESNLKPLNSSSQKSVSITIPKGASLKDVATLLEDKSIIRSSIAFEHYVNNKNASDEIKAGTYDLSPSQSVPEIVSIITGGKVSANLITILPGQRLDQIRQTFINSGYTAADVDRALNPSMYKNHPALVDKPSGANLEGYLYPESFQKTVTPEDIIRQSLDQMQKRLTPDIRNAIAAQGLSVHKGVILASIIEREADRQADRGKIAQVFLSRLRAGIKLESDATALYGAAIVGKPLSVHYNSAYNTYTHGGLTPGPISNVTESSLEAVAHPARTSYLYFVAGDDGTIYFSSTKQEHEAAVSKYCHENCQ